jgi:hypothetical protein
VFAVSSFLMGAMAALASGSEGTQAKKTTNYAGWVYYLVVAKYHGNRETILTDDYDQIVWHKSRGTLIERYNFPTGWGQMWDKCLKTGSDKNISGATYIVVDTREFAKAQEKEKEKRKSFVKNNCWAFCHVCNVKQKKAHQ